MNATKRPWYAHRDMGYLIMGKPPFNQIWNGPQGANDQPGWKSASEIRQIARIFGQSKEEIDTNAHLIVTAVNLHDELVKALEAILPAFDNDSTAMIARVYRAELEKARALLAKVKEG